MFLATTDHANNGRGHVRANCAHANSRAVMTVTMTAVATFGEGPRMAASALQNSQDERSFAEHFVILPNGTPDGYRLVQMLAVLKQCLESSEVEKRLDEAIVSTRLSSA